MGRWGGMVSQQRLYVSLTHSSLSWKLCRMFMASRWQKGPYFPSVARMASSSRCQYRSIIWASSMGHPSFLLDMTQKN